MNANKEQDIMHHIEALIEDKAKSIINESETYQEAAKKAKTLKFGFKYGFLGMVVNDLIIQKINEASLESVVK